MRVRDRKQREKVRIVDGKIVEERQHISHSATPVNSSQNDVSFSKALESFSLDLTSGHGHENNSLPQIEPEISPERSLPEDIEEVYIDDFRLVEGIMISKDKPYLPEEYRPELLMRDEQEFCPYLTKNIVSDYGAFMNYLMHTGRGKRTRYDYTISLRKWKKKLMELGGEVTIENINRILKQFSAARAQNLLLALKAYAEYRNFHQDSKLLILLTTSLTLYKPARSPKQTRSISTEAVTEEEARHYRALAKDLCKQGNKDGIWIGLSLLGVPPGNLATVTFPDKSHVTFIHRRKEKKAKCEYWLYTACHSIDDWRLGRRAVHLGVSKYEITPMALNQCSTHR